MSSKMPHNFSPCSFSPTAMSNEPNLFNYRYVLGGLWPLTYVKIKQNTFLWTIWYWIISLTVPVDWYCLVQLVLTHSNLFGYMNVVSLTLNSKYFLLLLLLSFFFSFSSSSSTSSSSYYFFWKGNKDCMLAVSIVSFLPLALVRYNWYTKILHIVSAYNFLWVWT